ncbi:MAG TPA: hypothetical protein VFZ13_16105, partial [Gemmatimonadales bacterium]
RCMVVGLVLAVLALVWQVTRAAPVLRAGYVLMALVLPVWYFGTPEHLAFVLLAPYVALAVARLEGEGGSTRAAVAAGALAAAGVALEPALAVVPLAVLALEAWLARSARVVSAPEHAALGAALAVAFAVAVVAVPQLLETGPGLWSAWRALPRPSIGALLTRDIHVWIVWFALGAALLFGRTVAPRRRIAVLAAVTAAGLTAALLQRSGDGPDFFPAAAFAVMLLLALTVAAPIGRSRLVALRRVTAALLLVPLLYLFGAVTWRRAHGVFTRTRADQLVVMRLLGGARKDIAVLSADLADVYPVTLELGHRFVPRYPSLWAALLPEAHPMRAAMLRHYGDDLRARPPEVIVVRAPRGAERRPREPAVDYLALLCRDAVARDILSRYRFAERAGGFELYRTDAEGAAACVSS